MKKTEVTNNWGVIGHESVIHFLQRSFLHQRVSHAYLFFGPPHVGKETLARATAAVLLCHRPVGADPCGDCPSCLGIAAGTHPDMVTLSRPLDEKTGRLKKNISVEQIRELRERLSQSTFGGRWKVAIITDADSVSAEAANALLKLLEEPTARTTIIVLAQAPDAVPATIRSRCQCLPCGEVPRATLLAALRARGISHAMADELSAVAGGCPGISLTYATHPTAYQDYQAEARQLLALATRGPGERLQLINALHQELSDDERPTDAWTERLWIWTGVLRDALLLTTATPELNNLWLKNDPQLATLYQRGTVALTHSVAAAYRCHEQLQRNANVQLVMEDFCLALP